MIDQMSIRRKTCETTSLLYEAALKTNLSEQGDGPSNVNPTAGVRMREKYGNSVFIPDTSKPGGGIWVAASRDELMNSGLPQGDQILKSGYATGSKSGSGAGSGREDKVADVLDHSAHDTPEGFRSGNNFGSNGNTNDQDLLQGMQMSSTNVNPNINDVGIPMDPNIQAGGGGLQQLAGQDVSLLSSLR
jgi:hypothetical protein